MAFAVAPLLFLVALDVRWTAADACPLPDLSSFTQAAEGTAMVQIQLLPGSPAELKATRWGATITFLKPFQGTRRLEVPTCDDANRAAQTVLGLGLRGPNEFLTQELPQSLTPVLIQATPPPPTEPRLGLAVRAGALAQLLALPVPTPRFRAAAALVLESLEVEVGLRTGLPIEITPITGAPNRARIQFWPVWGSDAAGCWVPKRPPISFRMCGTVLVEGWNLEGKGVSEPEEGVGALVAPGMQLGGSLVLGRGFEVGFNAALRAHVVRPAAAFAGAPLVAASWVSLEFGGWAGWTL